MAEFLERFEYHGGDPKAVLGAATNGEILVMSWKDMSGLRFWREASEAWAEQDGYWVSHFVQGVHVFEITIRGVAVADEQPDFTRAGSSISAYASGLT